jgi:GrpB-like predicted nucleotidyltransferase (UPF0157 family)
MHDSLADLLQAYGFSLAAGRAQVQAPDPRWPSGAAALIGRLPASVAWHHAGSTAVAELLAKPVCDLVGLAPDAATLAALAPPLVAAGFLVIGEFGIPGRAFFRLRVAGVDYAHLHTYVEGEGDAARVLSFRNALRADAALREAYARTKFAALEAHPADRDRYTAAKSPFIRSHLARSG